jgi:hypothetical protein
MKKVLHQLRGKNFLAPFVIYLTHLMRGAYVFTAFPKIFGQQLTTVCGEDLRY